MKLALGTVQFGLNYGVANTFGRVTAEEARDILHRAQTCGIDTLDTAIAYGHSEAVLGQLGVEQWKTVTKLPAVPDDCQDVGRWVYDQIQQSMTRLRVKQLHGVLLHRPSQLLENMGPALYDALQGIKSKGITCKVGISVYGPAELDVVLDVYKLDLVQAPMSILDRRMVDSGWIKRLHETGVEVHARSVFLQGLLLMPSGQRSIRFKKWFEIWNAWDNWLAKAGVTPLQACLRYFNDFPQIDRLVVGVDSAVQLSQILEAYKGNLSSLPAFDLIDDERLVNPATWDNLEV